MADTTDLRRAVGEQTQAVHERALQLCLTDTLAAAPEKTGNLKALTDVTPSSLAGEFTASGSIFSLAPYAGYTDTGTEPHPIFGNPYLHFFWENGPAELGGPGWYTFPYVNHPGTAGTQWFNSGSDDGEPMASRWEQACIEAGAD